jgi:outer membrane protein assembly factor BamB
VFGEKVFFIRYLSNELGGTLLDISGAKPAIIWTNQKLASQLASPILLNGLLFIGQGGPSLGPGSKPMVLRCLDVDSGSILWEQAIDDAPVCFTAADGKLILLSEKGTLAIAQVDRTGYREISRCDVFAGEKKPRKFWTPPVLCNGRIYCRNFAGELVCIDVRG